MFVLGRGKGKRKGCMGDERKLGRHRLLSGWFQSDLVEVVWGSAINREVGSGAALV